MRHHTNFNYFYNDLFSSIVQVSINFIAFIWSLAKVLVIEVLSWSHKSYTDNVGKWRKIHKRPIDQICFKNEGWESISDMNWNYPWWEPFSLNGSNLIIDFFYTRGWTVAVPKRMLCSFSIWFSCRRTMNTHLHLNQ